ncbi:MAG: hypothetical protein LC109_01745 [Bacteroidia bacterium]|nr:hypothetical protein [Bacteroidia bacterium]
MIDVSVSAPGTIESFDIKLGALLFFAKEEIPNNIINAVIHNDLGI